MKTIIKNLKLVKAKMLSFICIIFACGFGNDLDLSAAFNLLACAELVVLPFVMNSFISVFPAILLLASGALMLLEDVPLVLSLIFIQLFLVIFIIFSAKSIKSGSLLKSCSDMTCPILMSIISQLIVVQGQGYAIAACLLSSGLYLLMLLRLLKKSQENMPAVADQEQFTCGEGPMALVKSGRISAYSDGVEEMKKMMERVEELMRSQKPFLSETYCLMDMAASVYTNKTYLSRTINMLTGKNFRQYINSYRVEYALQLMKDDHKLRVSELAELAGFHSSVTFGMAFKLNMGETPGEYLQKLKAGLE